MNFGDFFSSIATCVKHEPLITHYLEQAASLFQKVSNNAGKVIIVGNGGSAAMASHVTVDLVKSCSIRAMNFNEASFITCFANDFGYEHWVEEALNAYGNLEDLVVLISSSGSSKNILNAANRALSMGLPLITFSGFSPENKLRELGQINFWAHSTEYNVVEMTHHIWLLAIVERLRTFDKPE